MKFSGNIRNAIRNNWLDFGSDLWPVCLSLSLWLETLWMDFDEIFRKDWAWYKYRAIKFWRRSRALAEVSALRLHSPSEDLCSPSASSLFIYFSIIFFFFLLLGYMKYARGEFLSEWVREFVCLLACFLVCLFLFSCLFVCLIFVSLFVYSFFMCVRLFFACLFAFFLGSRCLWHIPVSWLSILPWLSFPECDIVTIISFRTWSLHFLNPWSSDGT